MSYHDRTTLPRVKWLAILLLLSGLVSFLLPVRIGLVLLIAGLTTVLVLMNHRAGWSLASPFMYLTLALIVGVIGPLADLLVIDRHEASWVLLGKPQSILIDGGFVVVVGVAALLYGYATSAGTDLAAAAPSPPREWDDRRAAVVIGLFAIFGIGAFGYVLSTINLGDLSSKRALPTVYVRVVVRFLAIGGLVALVTVLESDRSLFSPTGQVSMGLVGLYLLFGAIVSSRSTIIWTVILVIAVYVQYRKLSVSFVLGTGTACAIASGVILSVRSDSGVLGVLLSPWAIIDSFAGANRGHVVAISHLVTEVPHDIPFAVGATLVQWIVFPIPRAIWPDKPVNVGHMIGREVYGAPNGTPPMLFGDFYLNFWLPGVIVGSFLLGITLRSLVVYRRRHRESAAAIIVTSVALLVLAQAMPAVTGIVISLGAWLVPLGAAVLYVSHSTPELPRVRAATCSSAMVESGRKTAAALQRTIRNSTIRRYLSIFDQGPPEPP